MLVTTTHSIEGRRIGEYHSLVSGEAILGSNPVIAVDMDYETMVGGYAHCKRKQNCGSNRVIKK